MNTDFGPDCDHDDFSSDVLSGRARCSRCGHTWWQSKNEKARTIWYVVADLTNPAAEPFAVLSVDTSVKREGGVEGTVVSVHWQREEAERIAHEFNNGPLS